ncbi:hypothetical protein LINPERPRIM_LOCUS24441 [Linum perenne]
MQGPVGYGPTTLPLRHSDILCKISTYIKFVHNQLQSHRRHASQFSHLFTGEKIEKCLKLLDL